MSAFAVILPYLSSGFVPTESLPKGMRIFAEYQPLTPVIDTMRNALLGKPLNASTFLIAVLWCLGLIILFYTVSLVLFQRRLGK